MQNPAQVSVQINTGDYIALAERGLAQGGLTTIANAGVNAAVTGHSHFSWAGVAASALTSAVGNATTQFNPLTPYANVQSGPFDFANVAAQTVQGFAYDVARQEIAMALGDHGKINLKMVAADAFGNALGNSIVGAIQQHELDSAVNNLSPGAKKAYDNVSQRGYTPQQALAYAQDFQGIEQPFRKPSYSNTPSITPLTAGDFAILDVDSSGLLGEVMNLPIYSAEEAQIGNIMQAPAIARPTSNLSALPFSATLADPEGGMAFNRAMPRSTPLSLASSLSEGALQRVQFSLSPDQRAALNEFYAAGEYAKGYEYILRESNGSLDNDTQYWFRHAAEINSGADTPSNLYIRTATAEGYAYEGQKITAEQIQQTSDAIGKSVLGQIIAEGGVPPIGVIIQQDIANTLAQRGQSIGGWGGAFYYWDQVAGADGRTVGDIISSNPRELDKFVAVNKAATEAVIGRYGVDAANEVLGAVITNRSIPQEAWAVVKNSLYNSLPAAAVPH